MKWKWRNDRPKTVRQNNFLLTIQESNNTTQIYLFVCLLFFFFTNRIRLNGEMGYVSFIPMHYRTMNWLLTTYT